MASAVAQAYNGGLGQNPQRVPGTKPLVRGSEGQSLLKLKHLVFGRSMEVPNLSTFLQFRNAIKSDICLIFAKKSWVATKLGGAQLGACAPSPSPGPGLIPPLVVYNFLDIISFHCQHHRLDGFV